MLGIIRYWINDRDYVQSVIMFEKMYVYSESRYYFEEFYLDDETKFEKELWNMYCVVIYLFSLLL